MNFLRKGITSGRTWIVSCLVWVVQSYVTANVTFALMAVVALATAAILFRLEDS